MNDLMLELINQLLPFFVDLQIAKHRPIPSRDISESYIELPTVSGSYNRPPSLHSGSSLEQKGESSSLNRVPYVEESGSDGISVNSSDSRLSRCSGNSLESCSRSEDLRLNGRHYTRNNGYQTNVDHILQSYRSPPSYANRVGIQRGHSQNAADKYRHPPPYREMRTSMGFRGVKQMMYSRSESLLNRPLSGQLTASYPDIRMIEGVGLRQLGQHMPKDRQLRNSTFFRKVDQATMTDEGAEESDSGSQELRFPVHVFGSPQQTNLERMSHSNPYVPYSGLSFPTYAEPHLHDSRMYNFNQSPNTHGIMMSRPTGHPGLYSPVNGNMQIYNTPPYERSQWSAQGSVPIVPGLEPNTPGMNGNYLFKNRKLR